MSVDRAKSALFPSPDQVHSQGLFSEQKGVEHADCLIRFALGAHGDERKAFRRSTFSIFDDVYRCDVPRLCKECVQVLFGNGPG